MIKKLLSNIAISVYAEGGKGGAGSQNRANSGNNFARPTSEQRRGNETMSNYYNRTKQSALGGTLRKITQVKPRGTGTSSKNTRSRGTGTRNKKG